MTEKRIDADLLDRFSAVYRKKLWGNEGSVSGPGSRAGNPMVESAISALEFLIEKFEIGSVADIPCGDFAFLHAVTDRHPDVRYVGYDIVPELIDENRKKHPKLTFEQLDIVSDIPECFDLIFTKELMIHLTNDQIFHVISNIKQSKSTYMLASNSFGVENVDLTRNVLGYARPIDLLAPPFALPTPLWRNNFYAFWRLSDVDCSR